MVYIRTYLSTLHALHNFFDRIQSVYYPTTFFRGLLVRTNQQNSDMKNTFASALERSFHDQEKMFNTLSSTSLFVGPPSSCYSLKAALQRAADWL